MKKLGWYICSIELITAEVELKIKQTFAVTRINFKLIQKEMLQLISVSIVGLDCNSYPVCDCVPKS